MKAVRFARYGPPSVLSIEEIETPIPRPGESLVRIDAASINPSDVKNVAGAFHTPLPRTPGRDYAGTVVDGDGLGREVWGSGPRFGIDRDGSHGQFVVVPSDWLADKPQDLTMEQASAIGVPFIVAWNGLIQAAELQPGETVLVTGASGAVGRAVSQVAHWNGARVIGADIVDGPAEADVFVNTKTDDLVARVRAVTGDKGVDLVYDSVGGPMFEQGLRSLRQQGRQVAIASSGERRVCFDLIDFYHARLRLIGVDSLKLDGGEIAAIMNALRPGFESGALRPFEVRTRPLDEAVAAYEDVEKGARSAKQVLMPQR
jgi:NADPH:quinone reductase